MPFGKKQNKKIKKQKITDLGKKKKSGGVTNRHTCNYVFARTQKHYGLGGPKLMDVYACTNLKCHNTQVKNVRAA